MKINIKQTLPIFKKAFKEWNEMDPFRQSAIIAYYSVFSLPGLLVLIVTVAGFIWGADAVSGRLFEQLSATMGSDTAEQMQTMLDKANKSKDSVWATIIGAITIIIGATGVFAQFQKTLNIIWEVKADPKKSGILAMLKTRLLSFGFIISIAFLLLVSFAVTSMLTAFGDWLKSQFPDALVVLFYALNFLISLAIISVLFALMFKFFPDAKIKWRHVWVGALVTGLLFEIGKSALSLYFGRSDPGEGYGAAASIILILLWVSYSSMIVLYGAEFTKQHTNAMEGEIPPKENAVPDKERKQARKESSSEETKHQNGRADASAKSESQKKYNDKKTEYGKTGKAIPPLDDEEDLKEKKESGSKVDAIMGNVKEYVQLHLQLVLLNVYEKVSQVISAATAAIILGVFGVIVLLFASIGLAVWVGTLLEKPFLGYFIVAGFYMLVAGVLLWQRNALIRLPVVNSVVRIIYYAEEEEEEEEKEEKKKRRSKFF
jgi:membrane protein